MENVLLDLCTAVSVDRFALNHLIQLAGTNPTIGAWSEYVLANAKLAISLPKDLPFEDAAGLGICGFTACQMLYMSQSLPTPFKPASEPVDVSTCICAKIYAEWILTDPHLVWG